MSLSVSNRSSRTGSIFSCSTTTPLSTAAHWQRGAQITPVCMQICWLFAVVYFSYVYDAHFTIIALPWPLLQWCSAGLRWPPRGCCRCCRCSAGPACTAPPHSGATAIQPPEAFGTPQTGRTDSGYAVGGGVKEREHFFYCTETYRTRSCSYTPRFIWLCFTNESDSTKPPSNIIEQSYLPLSPR